MLPSKHLKELEKREKLHERAFKILPFTVFIATFFLIAPLVHELSHFFALFIEGCRTSIVWGIGLTGLRAEVKPLCTLKILETSLFYLSGYLSSLIIGLIALKYSGVSSLKDNCLKAFGTGFLLSIVATGTTKGDFFTLGSIWSVKPNITSSFLIMFTLVVSMIVLFELVNLWDQNGSTDKSRKP